jgi:hypothetical protein
MKSLAISRVGIGIAAVVLASTLAYGQDPQDQTPSAPARPAQGAAGSAGARPTRGGPPEALPQMPMNGGDVHRDEIVASERAELEALKSGDVATVGAAMTDDAVFVDANGILERCAVRAGVAGQRGGVVYVDGERDAAGPSVFREGVCLVGMGEEWAAVSVCLQPGDGGPASGCEVEGHPGPGQRARLRERQECCAAAGFALPPTTVFLTGSAGLRET